MHLFYCSTSGARDWHGCQQPSRCPGTATSSLHPALCVCHHPAVPWKPLNPPWQRSCCGHKATPQPSWEEGPSRAGAPGSDSGLGRADTAGQGLWDPRLQEPGCPWGQAEPGRGAWGLLEGADLVSPAWCSGHVHGAQCPLPSTWCSGFAVSHRPVECSAPSQSLPAAQNQCGASAGASVQSSVPSAWHTVLVLVPVGGTGGCTGVSACS